MSPITGQLPSPAAQAAMLRGVLESAVSAIVHHPSSRFDRELAAERLMLMPEAYRAEHDAYIANYVSIGIKKIIGIGRETSGRRKDATIFTGWNNPRLSTISSWWCGQSGVVGAAADER